jgi:hypothetical protein
MSHKFNVGEQVDLAHRMMLTPPRGQYEVRRQMPASDQGDDDPLYRVKSADETYERVAQESDLTLTETRSALAE